MGKGAEAMTMAGTIAETVERVRLENKMEEAANPGRMLQMDHAAASELAVAIVKDAAKEYEAVLMKLLEKPEGKKRGDLMRKRSVDEAFFLGQLCSHHGRA